MKATATQRETRRPFFVDYWRDGHNHDEVKRRTADGRRPFGSWTWKAAQALAVRGIVWTKLRRLT